MRAYNKKLAWMGKPVLSKNVYLLFGFCTGFVAAENRAGDACARNERFWRGLKAHSADLTAIRYGRRIFDYFIPANVLLGVMLPLAQAFISINTFILLRSKNTSKVNL